MTTRTKRITFVVVVLLAISTSIGYVRYNKAQETVIPTEIRTPQDLDQLSEQADRVAEEAKANAEAAAKEQ